jgi:hypothetical protein
MKSTPLALIGIACLLGLAAISLPLRIADVAAAVDVCPTVFLDDETFVYACFGVGGDSGPKGVD